MVSIQEGAIVNLSNLIPAPPEGNDLLVKLTKGPDDTVDIVAQYTPDHATWTRKAVYRQKDASWNALSFRILEKQYASLMEALRHFSPQTVMDIRESKKEVVLGFVDGPVCLLCYCPLQEAAEGPKAARKPKSTPKAGSPQEEPSQAQGGAIPAKAAQRTVPPELLVGLPRNLILRIGAMYGMTFKRLTKAGAKRLSSHMVTPDCFNVLPDDVIRHLLSLKGYTTSPSTPRIALISMARDLTW
jgi:hypothetical protein